MTCATMLKLNAKSLELARTIILSGGLVVGPSRSNYNIMCNPFDPVAIARVFEAKRRTKFGPLTLAVHSIDRLEDWVELPTGINPARLRQLWPGEITLIFNKRHPFPEALTCGAPTVGITWQGESGLQDLAGLCDHPIAVTSANLSGQGGSIVSITTAVEHVGSEVDLILNGGSEAERRMAGRNVEGNTIVDFTFGRPHLVRAGLMPLERVRQVFPQLVEDPLAYRAMLLNRADKVSGPGCT